jgi:hypothetical protein
MMSDQDPDLVKAAEGLKNLVKNIVNIKDPVYKIMDVLTNKNFITEANFNHKIFTYVQALEYAIEKKLKYPNIRSTLLKLEPSSKKGFVVVQVFIDDAGDVLKKGKGYLGQKIETENLDDELKDILGDEESIVINLPQK